MPDQFKKFLQKHRAQLDNRDVPSELFNQIMDSSFNGSQVDLKIGKQKYGLGFYVLRIAAIGLVLITSYVLYFNFQTFNTQTPGVNTTEHSNTLNSKEDTKTDLVETLTSVDENSSIETQQYETKRISKENIKSIQTSKLNKVNTMLENPLVSDTQKTSNLAHSQITDSGLDTEFATDTTAQVSKSSHETTGEALANNMENEKSLDSDLIPAIRKLELVTDSSVQQNSSSGILSLNQKVKKSIFSFLSKKSRKWTNDAIAIDTKSEQRNTIVDIQVNTSQLAFSKSFKLNPFKD